MGLLAIKSYFTKCMSKCMFVGMYAALEGLLLKRFPRISQHVSLTIIVALRLKHTKVRVISEAAGGEAVGRAEFGKLAFGFDFNIFNHYIKNLCYHSLT